MTTVDEPTDEQQPTTTTTDADTTTVQEEEPPPPPPVSTSPKASLFAGLHMSNRSPVVTADNKQVSPALDNDGGLLERSASEQHAAAAAAAADVVVVMPPSSPAQVERGVVQSMDSSISAAAGAAPVTDKLLGMLTRNGGSAVVAAAVVSDGVVPVQETTIPVVEQESDIDDAPVVVSAPAVGDDDDEDVVDSANEDVGAKAAVGAVEQPIVEQEAAPAPAASYSMFGGWFGSSKTPAEAAVPPEPPAAVEQEPPAAAAGAETLEDEPPVAAVDPLAGTIENGNAPAATANEPEEEQMEAEEPGSAVSTKPEMDPQEKQHLEEAFHNDDDATQATATSAAATTAKKEEQTTTTTTITKQQARPRPRGLGEIHADTPVPNSDVALRLLRKFAYKTRPKIITTYGGSKSRSIFSYLFSSKEDPTFAPYRDLMDILFDDGEDRDIKDDSERVVEAVLGETGDSMAKARLAVAAFCYLFSMWGHASSRFFEQKDTKSQKAFSELLSAGFDSASLLVAHGCLDGVEIGMGLVDQIEYSPVVHLLAQSVFNSDLTVERNELAAMKFLLSTGCRTASDGESMLRGSHLLQTIRVLYHVYLTTEFSPNKTTARAALQQLVTSVFTRVVKTDKDDDFVKTSDHFPSKNHRDAFLVMRSICKLSMRNLPDPNSGMHSHVGLTTSGSNDMWDGNKDGLNKSARGEMKADEEERHEHAYLVYTGAIHPALESKILALELLLYVLQNIEFSRGFIHRSGAQFHAAIRNYLCVSLLKNCTSANTRVVELSLRIFVPLVRSFRTVLKTEIEAFVTNVFFVILDSKNSPVEHKSIVVKTFDEICSDPATLAEIFLNYDCDLSAVDLFHRIVNTLSRVSRTGMQEPKSGAMSFMGGASAARSEKFRIENRELRLDAMKALRQVLASLHASIVEPMPQTEASASPSKPKEDTGADGSDLASPPATPDNGSAAGGQQNLVEIYGSKKKRRAEEAEVVMRFNQKPSAGLKYAVKCGHIDGEDPVDVARYLLKNKDAFEKTQIGECLGREAQYQKGFSLKVLHEYVSLLDFSGLMFDDGIRFFLSGFRLPGEAQKIDRIMEKFAERYTEQNPDVFPTADVAFILAFSIIMLNTDLHNPAIKEERRMTKDGFTRNNRGICDGQDLPEELLNSIFDRIKASPISLKEDDEARERAGDAKNAGTTGLPTAMSPASFFSSHYDDMDRARESNFQKERDHIVRTTESLLKRRRHGSVDQGKAQSRSRSGKSTRSSTKFVRTEDSGLRDEYVSPMFDVAWGPSLAAFSTAIESANGTVGSLVSVASDEELELAAENAAETIEVCLTGFRFAIGTAGLCGNDTARDAYMLALSRFSQLGTGVLLEPRHVRCIQTMLSLAREDGELLGSSWEDVFKALSEINRFHQLFQLMARNDRAAASAAARRRRQLEEKEKKRQRREDMKAAAEDGESIGDLDEDDPSDTDDSLAESGLFSDEEDFGFDEDMDARAIDEVNARNVYDAVSEVVIESIYERSSSLSAPAVKDFVLQLCLVSRMEISVGGYAGHNVGGADGSDLTQVAYRQQHALLSNNSNNAGGQSGDQFHHSQPNIYNLQKLVEVMHYNMGSRPRLLFAELWTIVAGHLTGTALHSNPAIAMYAVDSFRQLSIQYLQRDELEVFEFQRRFLKPLETVMAKSTQVSTKELLLNCVDRIMHVFRGESTEADREAGLQPKGGLKSGWVPILSILGFGGRDMDLGISRMSFKILSAEIKDCLEDSDKTGVLLAEHFVETVNALLMFVNGPHEEVCLLAIDQLVSLAEFLSDDSFAPPQLKRRTTPANSAVHTNEAEIKQELELWWPILLGLSRSVGDVRMDVRSKGLDTLVGLTEQYFFPAEDRPSVAGAEDQIQTLQLIFRGILTPLLEFAETGSQDGQVPSVPAHFERFLNPPKQPTPTDEGAVEETVYTGWLETTFDPFMDACISICLRAVHVLKDESLVEEIFAILNNCLLSDSGALAVRGLWRLEQFITSDLDSSLVTDDTWATVSHMLRRCLSVRGLPSQPRPSPATDSTDGPTDEEKAQQEAYEEEIREFVMEDKILAERRFVGSNATMIAGLLLTSERFAESLGLRWRLFLIAGIGRAIHDWEKAATILEAQKVKVVASSSGPPDYRETALFGRMWMNRFILQLVAIQEVVQAPSDADPKSNRFAAAQMLVSDETQRLLSGFLEKEKAAAQYRPTEADEALHARFLALVTELMAGYSNMDSDHLKEMAWLSPVLLGSCIQSKNEEIRMAVQKLVQRLSPVAPVPYPAPPKTPDKEEVAAAEAATRAAAAQGEAKDAVAVGDDSAVATPDGKVAAAAVATANGDKSAAEASPKAAAPAGESWLGWMGVSTAPTTSEATEQPKAVAEPESDTAEETPEVALVEAEPEPEPESDAAVDAQEATDPETEEPEIGVFTTEEVEVVEEEEEPMLETEMEEAEVAPTEDTVFDVGEDAELTEPAAVEDELTELPAVEDEAEDEAQEEEGDAAPEEPKLEPVKAD